MISLKSYLNSNKVLVLSDQAVYSGTSFVVTVGLARIMSPKDFGILSSVILINFLIISICNALVIQPFQVNTHTVANKNSYSGFVILFQLILSFILIFTLFVLIRLNILSDITEHSFVIAMFTLGFVMHDFFRKSFLAQNRIRKALIIDCFLSISQFFFLLVLYFHQKQELHIVILSFGLSYSLPFIVSLYFSSGLLIQLNEWSFFLITHVKQGSWLLLVALLQWGSNNIFVVTSGMFLGIESVGALRLVQSLFGILNVLLQTFENYVLPNATRLYQNSANDSKKYLKNISLKGSFLFGSVLLTLFIFSQHIIVWTGGEKYSDYGYLVKGMVVLYFILFAGYPIRLSIRMLILNRTFFVGYVLSFLFTLISYGYFIKHWQLNGVILGLILNQLLMLIYWQYQLNKNKFYLWK